MNPSLNSGTNELGERRSRGSFAKKHSNSKTSFNKEFCISASDDLESMSDGNNYLMNFCIFHRCKKLTGLLNTINSTIHLIICRGKHLVLLSSFALIILYNDEHLQIMLREIEERETDRDREIERERER